MFHYQRSDHVSCMHLYRINFNNKRYQIGNCILACVEFKSKRQTDDNMNNVKIKEIFQTSSFINTNNL